MRHSLIAAIDWLSVKLTTFSLLLTMINPDIFLKALSAVATSITIGYNAYKWYIEIKKNRKIKSDESDKV